MKAKVIIENGVSEIILTPENDFERTLIEDAENSGDKQVIISSQYSLGSKSNHKIQIKITR